MKRAASSTSAPRSRPDEPAPQSDWIASIVASAEDAIVGATVDGKIVSWNAGAARLYGYALEEVRGRRLSDVLGGPNQPELKALLERVGAGERADFVEIEVRTKGDVRVDVSMSAFPVRDGAGRLAGVSTIGRDINVQRAVTTVLSRVAAIVDSSRDAIIAATPTGSITSWNPGAERLYGYGSAEVAGRDLASLSPPEHAGAWPPILERVRSGAVLEPFETVRRRRDGTLVPVLVTVSPLRDLTDQVIGCAAVERDLSAEKALERMRSDFVAMLSHDVKNPVIGIMAITEIMRREKPRGADLARYLDRIDANAWEALTLAINFVDVSRIDASGWQFRFEEASLNDIVGSAVGRQQVRASLRGISIEASLDYRVPRMSLDDNGVERLVSNLLSNAIKFSPEGRPVHVETADAGERVLLRIRDHGPGVAPQMRSDLFERYGKTEERWDSSGLGLFVVRTIADGHGATIAASFPDEGGTVFEVAFPKRRPLRPE